jgi:uncharacterized DUF497 family protein
MQIRPHRNLRHTELIRYSQAARRLSQAPKRGNLGDPAPGIFGARNASVVFEQGRAVNGEARWQAIGRVEGQILLLVAHTYEEDDGEETIRILSARRAGQEEREAYFRQFDPRGYER